MSQMQLIINVIGWERRLEHEQERKSNRRPEPFLNFLAAPQPCHKERKENKISPAPVNFLQALNPNQ